MATTNAENKVRTIGVERKLNWPIAADGTFDINGGDLVYWDSAAGIIKPIGSNANAATLAGVAEDASFVNLYGTKKYRASLGARYGQVHALNTKAGDSYVHGAPVFFDTDAQTVTSTDPGGGNVIGYAQCENGAVTGASGVKVNVFVVAKSPTTLG